jgi:Ni,Fe-hydrogenase III large subunit
VTSSIIVHRVATDDIASSGVDQWRRDLLERLGGGARVATLYGRRVGDQVTITAVLQDSDRSIHVSRTIVPADVGYHAMTTSQPALHCFERELHEQTGLRIAGHPWLRPVRYEGRDQAAMNEHHFYKVEGKEVHEVAVGPIHAGVIEPGSFRFMCHGEQVIHLEVQLGYQHRGVEKRLLGSDPRRLAPLVETITGDTSVGHAWAYCAAIESLAGCELDLETELARAVALELERIAMHLASLSGLAADVGFLQGATTYGRLRTTAINTTMRLCGSRFGRTAIVPGGLGRALISASMAAVTQAVQLLATDVAIINDCFLASRTVRHRLQHVGVLTESDARSVGIVGLVARASGLDGDLRSGVTRGAYDVVPLAAASCDEGDCWARARIRILEIDASLAWLAEVSATYPGWARSKRVVGALAPRQLVVAMAEGWRGEIVHCLETDEAGGLAHYKVQDPSLRNWMGLALAVRGNEISDFPICNKSFDLSYCGNDL